VYADAQAKQQQSSQQAPGANDAQQEAKKDDGNVVDAEYTEVKDKKTG
jgi:molecular chaperone DnaK